MSEYSFTIPGTFPGLNQYIKAERGNRYSAAKMKSRCEDAVIISARKYLKGVKITRSVVMDYTWYEPNKRRDKSNICAFGRKCIEDGLIKAGVLKNDGWKEIVGFSDSFFVDRENPRIEILIKEI